MKSLIWKSAAGLLVVVVGVLAFGRTTYASHLKISIDETTNAVAGQPAQLRAHLTDDSGAPVAGATVSFYTTGTFLGATGQEEIASAVTNDQGLAVATYEPRDAGTYNIQVDYSLPKDTTVEHSTSSMTVSGAVGQVYNQTAGVHIPGLNSWLIIVVASIIWSILFGVGITVIRIARASGSAEGRALPEAQLAAAPVAQRQVVEAGVRRS